MVQRLDLDIPEYLRQAESSLKATRLLIDNGYLAEAISRGYYAMFYAATADSLIR